MDPFDDAVRTVAAQVLGVQADQLSPETALADLRATEAEVVAIIGRAAQSLAVPLFSVVTTAPIYRSGAGPLVMWSLRLWAALHPGARTLLDRLSSCRDAETIGSIAASLRAGRYTGSGRALPIEHPPLSGRQFALWTVGAVVLLLAVVPVAWAADAFLRVYRAGDLRWSMPVLRSASWFIPGYLFRYTSVLPVCAGILVVVQLSNFLPGWLALRRNARWLDRHPTSPGDPT